MPALRKPHRVAVVIPQLTLEGGDAAYVAEASLLVWMACIEVLRRHPGIAVYDPESTPLWVRDGHFAPLHAEVGATPTDAFYASTRRDELVWLELGVPRGSVKLHAVGKRGERQVFDAIGRSLGDQIGSALGAWLGARGLSQLKRLEGSAEDLIAAVRVIGPSLVERARSPIAVTGVVSPPPKVEDEDIEAAIDALVPTGERVAPQIKRSSPARALANRLPQGWRVAALRTLELVFGESLLDLVLAVDPEHPQALLARWHREKDPALLRRAIAASPGWARPYSELRDARASILEAFAGIGIAALCRPAQLEAIESSAVALRDFGFVDEALRVLTRAYQVHAGEPPALRALLDSHRATGCIGAWLAAAERAAVEYGCPPDPALPRYSDQIQTDLLLSEALLHAGRFHAAVTLRANRLDGIEREWPRESKALASWRDQPRFAAWCAARESWFAGDPARALELFGAIDLDATDLAMFLDALVATGREAEVGLAWALHGLGRKRTAPAARLAAARGLLAAGDHRRGLEELWRVELGEPGGSNHVAVAHCGLLVSVVPLEIAETALAERVGAGAAGLARRMARDIADFIPGAAKSAVVMRALGKPANLEFDPDTLAAFSCRGRTRAAIDALFAELEPESETSDRRTAAVERRAARRGTKVERPITVVIDPMVGADRLVNEWFERCFVDASEDDAAALARAAIYVAGQALGRYLVATTAVPSVSAGALRTVAAEALALVRCHRDALSDRDVHALLGVIDPLLRRVDRWVGTSWLAAVERACGIDERAGGDLHGFTHGTATVAARILGPEETAVLAASVARLHRERPEGWEAATSAQASRLALHTGRLGFVEWADATVAELAAKTIERDDAIDTLLTAAYLAEGITAAPALHAARLLLEAGRGPVALATLTAALPERDAIKELAPLWKDIDVPIARDRAAAEAFEALQRRDPARAERLGRWIVALDPDSPEANRNLGLACAQQGKLVDALHHLARGARDQATQIVAGVLFQQGKLPDALAVLDHASRWYTRAEQWLGFAAIADAANDAIRSTRAYAAAFKLDPAALDETQRERATADVAPLPRPPAFAALDAGDFATAAAAIIERDWVARRAALTASRFRTDAAAVPQAALAAATAVLFASIGSLDKDAVIARCTALRIREQAYFARDPLPRLGDRARPTPVVPRGPDRIVVPGSKIARVGDYIALLRDLAALAPREALAQFDLDHAGYLEVAKAWDAAMCEDPSLAAAISAGLARR